MKNMERHPIGMILLGIFGISLSSILVRYSSAPSAVTAAWRLLWTVLLMTPVVLGSRTVRKETAELDKKLFALSILSGFFLAVHFALWFESLAHTSVASSTTIVCTEVIWVSLGYCLFQRGHLSVRAVCAIGVTVLGSGLIAWTDAVSADHYVYGDLLALLAAVAVSLYTLIGRTVRKSVSTTAYTYIVYTACAAALLLLCIAKGYGLFQYGLSSVVVGLLLAVFSTLLGHSLFSWCLKYFSPSFVAVSKLCEPVAAAAMAAILFGEEISLMQFAGGALILGGVGYASWVERQ